MLAATYTTLGPASEVLRIEEIDTPLPGPGEIRVKLYTSGVNPSDWKARLRGRGGAMPFDKIVPQSDGAGVIDDVGEGININRIGQRVWVMNGQWKRAFGTAAEFIVLKEKYVIELPDGTSFDDGACFGIPFLTAHRAVTYDGDVTGQTILISGGAGAVGHHAIQVAKFKGARVITTVSSREKTEHALAAGADEVVNYRDEDAVLRVLELTGGAGVDRIIELNLSANAPMYGNVLAPGGTVIIYGTDKPTAAIPAMDFIVRGAELKWFIVYELSDHARSTGVKDLNKMLEENALFTTVASSFSLSDIVAAHEMVEDAHHIGNVIINIV